MEETLDSTSNTLEQSKKLKCLVFIGRGIVSPFISEDIILALRSLGHEAEAFALTKDEAPLLEKMKSFNPDLLFSLDGRGLHFDSVRKWDGFRVAWFVDNPFYFEETKSLTPEDYIFSWDEEYVKDFKDLGFQNAHFLPLATNPDRFFKGELTQEDQEKFASDVNFVGSLGDTYDVIRQDYKTRFPQEVNRLVDKLVNVSEHLFYPDRAEEVLKVYQETRKVLDLSIRPLVDLMFDSLVDAKRRHMVVDTLTHFNTKLYGTDGLKAYAKGNATFKGGIDYQKDSRKVYQASKISINSTRPQLRMTVNQRVFDVFAAGGFLLTDYRTFLSKAIPFPSDLICFTDAASLKARIEYFLQKPAEREDLTLKAGQFIRENHTYVARMQEILAMLKYA